MALSSISRQRGQNLVSATTQALRDHIFALAPGTLIGSLHQIARALDVGVVTLQQAARVLEHEGLLDVRRGPGGGYYAARPDDAALERAMDAYLRMHPTTWEEALDMTSLLFNELVAAAATSLGESDARPQLLALRDRLDAGLPEAEFGPFEFEFQELLFRMVRRPLFEMLTRVTLHFASSRPVPPISALHADAARWREGRRRIIQAIVDGDPDLARFEAERQNRAVVRGHVEAMKRSLGTRP